jgi:hypothetical protein
MAESTPSPALPSTADANPYVPVSWLAVAALTVAVLFAVLLLILGGIAFLGKKPLLMEELLVLPGIAIVLSFAARRVIRNSEGTRTGEKLAVNAWWLSLILGLCYIAYLGAIDFAIHRDATSETEQWMRYLSRGGDDDVGRAFHRMLPPGARADIAPDDTQKMRSRHRDEFLKFRTSDLAKLAQRNKDELKFERDSVTWTYRPGVTECLLTGAVKCPEGTFPITVILKGVEGVSGAEGGGRQWMLERAQPSGFIEQGRATRTPYGWLVLVLERSGTNFGKLFVSNAGFGGGSHYFAYRGFIAEGGAPGEWIDVARTPLLQLALAAPSAIAGPTDYADYVEKHLFGLPGGAEPQNPEQRKQFEHAKQQFKNSWERFGIRPAGDKLKDRDGSPIDKESLINITDRAVEVRVPIEIPLVSPGKIETARGYVVVECKDPKVLAELKQLKDAADPDKGTLSPPEDMLRRSVAWRVVRIESDMAPISVSQQSQGPGE